jgi:hypothetical protein
LLPGCQGQFHRALRKTEKRKWKQKPLVFILFSLCFPGRSPLSCKSKTPIFAAIVKPGFVSKKTVILSW